MSLDTTRKIYQRKSDQQLLRFAEQNGDTLRLEALTLLAEELQNRGIGLDLVEQWQIATPIISKEQIEYWIKKISYHKCPVCKRNNPPLYCLSQRMIISYVIGSVYMNHLTICCQDCKRKPFWTQSAISLFLGWWSFKGILATPYVLFNNVTEFFQSKKENNIAMENFVRYYYIALEQAKKTSTLDKLLVAIANGAEHDFSHIEHATITSSTTPL